MKPADRESTGVRELPDEFPLIGRDSELRRIKSHFREDSDAHTLLVRGEAGVGKTRLIEVATEHAAKEGMQVFHGRAFPLDSGLSYAVLADAFVPFLRDAEAYSLETLTRGRLPELYRLFPAAASGDEIPDVPAGMTPEDIRTALFWSFSELLSGLAKRAPVLVVAEDLHWADPSALELLHFAIRQLKDQEIRFICSSNEGLRGGNAPLLDFESSLSSSGLADTLNLDPLAEAQVQRLISRTFEVSEDVCRDFAARLQEWSGGNPLFVTETLRSLVDSEHLFQREGTWCGWEIEEFDPPSEVRDLVESRLAHLSQPALRVVEVAATMGDRIRFAILASVAGLSEEKVLDVVDELRAKGILGERVGATQFSLVFRHPLIRECVYARLSQPRARILHQEVGDAIEREDPGVVVDRAEELAYHFHCSGNRSHSEKALQYLVVAGRRALEQHADQAAARHLGAALELSDRRSTQEAQGPAPEEIIGALATALRRTGRYDEAIDLWKRVLRNLPDREKKPKSAELRYRLGRTCFWAGRYAEALSHYEAGISAADEHPLLRAQIQLARAYCLQELARWDEAANDAEASLKLAEQYGDIRTQTRAHHALALHAMWRGRPEATREHAWQAIDKAASCGDLMGSFRSHLGLAVLEGLTGNLEKMRERIIEARKLATELHSPILELQIDELSLQEAHARGDWDKAISMGEQSIARARALGQRSLLPRLLVWTALPILGRGDIERGRTFVEEAWELAGLDADGSLPAALDLHAVVPAFIGRVGLDLAMDDISAATAAGERGLELANRSGAAIWSLHHLIPLLAEGYLLARDLEGAQRIGQRLRRDSERMNHVLGLAWADACDALVTWLSGDIEGGSVRLRAAADRLEGIPMVYDSARVRRQLGGRLAELDREDEALSELRRAHSVFRKLGAEPELEKTRKMFRELETRPPPRSLRTGGVGGLTGRELEVARLVSARQSNKAIAKELGISPRTVTTHLTNIYGKLGVASRGDLVDLVRERGWAAGR